MAPPDANVDADASAIEVRPATPEDAPVLAALRFRFRTELGEAVETEEAFVARTREWFATRLAGEAWHGWVAVEPAGEIVGHVFVQFVEKVPNPLPESEAIGYLTNLYVAPPWRNRGVGSRLLGEAVAACEDAEVDGIILWPSDESVSLYLRHGFAPPRELLERPRRS